MIQELEKLINLYKDEKYSIGFYVDTDFLEEDQYDFVLTSSKVGIDHSSEESIEESIYYDEVYASLQEVLNKFGFDTYGELKRYFVDKYKNDKSSYDKIITEFENKNIDCFVYDNIVCNDGVND